MISDMDRKQRTRTLAAITLLGFSSGLPLALSASTLEAWCAVSGVSLQTIGVLKLVGFAYVFKFLWAPLVDRFALPGIGRRRSWMLAMQVAIVAALVAIAGLSPSTSLGAIALLAMLLAAFSATQDIAVDAYRADQLLPQDRGLGAAFGVAGYRAAMIVSGGLALSLASYLGVRYADIDLGFRYTFVAMAVLMGVGLIGTAIAPEQVTPPAGRSFLDAYLQALRELLTRVHAWRWLALIVLYKLGNAFALSLSSTFLLRGAGYALSEVGWVNKVFGLGVTLVGAFAAGMVLQRWTLWRALWIFGVLQGLGVVGFLAVALGWHGDVALITAVGAENLTSGLGTGAFVALLMALCNRRFSATQYAVFSALDSAGRIFIGPLAGFVAADFGWTAYFTVSLLFALPGLLVLVTLRPQFAGLGEVRTIVSDSA
jgi:MFS transporter, PAT family, beta-lactamase induction signal transducer AmpG